MSVLLTGANGFVGRHVSALFAATPLPRGIDLKDRAATRSALAGQRFDAVIHLAAQSSIGRAWQEPWPTMQANLGGTINLLYALQESGFRGRFVFASSGDVYGILAEGTKPLTETTDPNPCNPYAMSKLAAETFCHHWRVRQQVEAVIARSFNLLGPGQDERFGIASFAKQIVQIRRGLRPPVVEVGDIDVTRDYLDVRDAARAYQALLGSGADGEVYHICSGHGFVLRDLLHRMAAIAGVDISLEVRNELKRQLVQPWLVGNPAKLRGLGWEPAFDIETSMRDLLADWERRLDG